MLGVIGRREVIPRVGIRNTVPRIDDLRGGGPEDFHDILFCTGFYGGGESVGCLLGRLERLLRVCGWRRERADR